MKVGGRVRRLRILLVSPYPVFPTWSGGKVRIVALARALAEGGHAVTVVTPYDPRQRRHLPADEPFRLRQVMYPFLVAASLRDRPFPYLSLASFHPGLRPMMTALFHTHDVIQFEHAAFAGLLDAVPAGAVIGYDAHNVEADYLRQECRSVTAAAIVGRRMERLERSLVGRSHRVFVVSQPDRVRLHELYGVDTAAFVAAPNGISAAVPIGRDPTAMLRRHPGLDRFGSRAVYSGSDVEHNRLAVRFLLEEVAPRTPDVGLILQGGCGRRFAGQTSLANVFFDHDHRHFAEYAVAGTVGLNPCLSGSGTNLKVLNYLAHGLPVLSTSFGMRGYEDLRGFVRHSEQADFVASLLAAGFPEPPSASFLMDRYAWRKIAGRLEDAYLNASVGEPGGHAEPLRR